ncbi:MAG TPA: HEAT repeat domain-containing protein [Aggregatilineaceae bacterium]|nr:HEAT repeat domain-containing protein [Aggregatilineaceae bacterium]
MINDLLHQLNSPDPAQRRSAIIALANSRDPSALSSLARIYQTDPDPALREMALKAGRYIQQYAKQQQQASGSSYTASAGATSTGADKPPISKRDEELARGYLDAATGHATAGDRIRALENLGKALSLNPTLQKESFVMNLIMNLTGLSVADAMPILTNPDRRAMLIASMGGKQKVKRGESGGSGDEWGKALLDIGIYWIVTSLILVLVFIVAMDAVREIFETSMRNSPSSNVSSDDLDTFFDAGVIALTIVSIIYSLIYTIGNLIYGAAIHFAAVTFLGGNGTLAGLYHRLFPFWTVLMVVSAAGLVIMGLSGSFETTYTIFVLISLLGTFGVIYYQSALVGKAYNFGSGSGCVAIFLGTVLLVIAQCCLQYVLFSALQGMTLQ